MKNKKLILAMIASTLVAFSACTKQEAINLDTILGTYSGTLTAVSGLKSTAALDTRNLNATAVVSDMGNGQIQVHFNGAVMDTTFMLNYYLNHDSVNLCLNGEAFEHMYGHSMMNDSNWGNGGTNGHGGMMGQGGMMGNGVYNTGATSDSTAWTSHMGLNHQAGDTHFGGFDLSRHTFGYTINKGMNNYNFQGTKSK